MTDSLKENREFYAEVISDPSAWLSSALQLLKSAEFLQEKIDPMWREYIDRIFGQKPPSTERLGSAHYQMVQLMLAGFGFENLLKFGYVRKNSERIQREALSSKPFPQELNTHDLWELSKLIGFSPSPPVERFLRKLTIHSRWTGRYPIPLDPQSFTKSIEYLSWSQSDSDDLVLAIEELCSHLGINYYTLNQRPT